MNRDLIAGETTVAVSARYGIALATLQRHRNRCLQAGISAIAAGKRNTHAALAIAALPSREELGGSYLALTKRIDEIVTTAEKQGSLAIAIQGLNSLRQNLDSLAHIPGHHAPAPLQIAVAVAPLDTSLFVAALAAALPDAEARLRFAQAMGTPIIDGTINAAAPSTPVPPVHYEN